MALSAAIYAPHVHPPMRILVSARTGKHSLTRLYVNLLQSRCKGTIKTAHMQELCRFLIKTCIYAKKVVPLRTKMTKDSYDTYS